MAYVDIKDTIVDWGNKVVSPGRYDGADIQRMGYSDDRSNWFWNIVQNGKVIAVTLGWPQGATIVRDDDAAMLEARSK